MAHLGALLVRVHVGLSARNRLGGERGGGARRDSDALLVARGGLRESCGGGGAGASRQRGLGKLLAVLLLLRRAAVAVRERVGGLGLLFRSEVAQQRGQLGGEETGAEILVVGEQDRGIGRLHDVEAHRGGLDAILDVLLVDEAVEEGVEGTHVARNKVVHLAHVGLLAAVELDVVRQVQHQLGDQLQGSHAVLGRLIEKDAVACR
mmetsp:Transcript_16515/g.42282  ORF Transcript_16515/g.42282 Transcript_16515/m.42282 type:complete len:206 (+) Transcript_16515:2605-3222(+)